jgi:hypothetical protein
MHRVVSSDTSQQHTDLRNELTEMEVNHFEKLDKMISEVKRTLTSSKEGLLATENKISKISKDLETKISLNIGGRIFTTTLGNLVQEKGTFFSAMFSDHFDSTPDKDGTYFIDRDSDLFVPIIRYLRNPTALPDFIQLDKDGLFDLFEQEVDFYQIRSLKEIMTEYIRIKATSTGFPIERVIRCGKSELWVDGTTIFAFQKCEAIQTEIVLHPCNKWKIRIPGKPNTLRVGVVTENYALYGLLNPVEIQKAIEESRYENDNENDACCIISSLGNRWFWPECLDHIYSVQPQRDWKCPRFDTQGYVVELTLKDGTLSINVNGTICDPAFQNIPSEYVYPLIVISLCEHSEIAIEKLE